MGSAIRGVATTTVVAVEMIVAACWFTLNLPLLFLPATYKWYRRGTAFFISTYQTFAALVLESKLGYGCEYIVTGDRIEPNNTLVISNHRTRLDWMMLWPVFTRFRVLDHLKIVLKYDIKSFPFMGWGAQMCRYIYLRRKWETDVNHFTDMLNLLAATRTVTDPESHQHTQIALDPYCLLIFPEGTDLHEKAIVASDAFAVKNNLPKYKHILHPRSKGFVYTLSHLRTGVHPVAAVQYVSDVTMAYTGHIAQSEKDIAVGRMPKQVHVHVNTFKSSDLSSSEADLERWLTDRFKQKEAALAEFYQHGGSLSLEAAIKKHARAPQTLPGQGAQLPGVPSHRVVANGDGKVSKPSKYSAFPLQPYFRAAVVMVVLTLFDVSLCWRFPFLSLAAFVGYVLVHVLIVPRFDGWDVLEASLYARAS
jgi:lysocardiolipin and lysophospholipid acyltransferase